MATNFSNKNISTIQLQGIDYHLKSIPFHATEEEWNLINYIPKQGETVVYDIDSKNQNLRFKTGDGFTQVKNLPFSLSTVQETQSQIDEAVAEKSRVEIIVQETSEFLPTLTIHQLTQEEYEQKIADGSFEQNVLYLTPDEEIDLSPYATEEYVDNKVAGMVDSAPETLDTLNELAKALGDDPNFATTIATNIGKKVDKVDGKDLSTNDYTTDEKNKLKGIEEGANKTVVDDSLSSISTNPVQNKIVNDAIGSLNTLVGDTKVSEQINSAISQISYPVNSINGKTGTVVLTASDVGALPADTIIPSIKGLATEVYVDNAVSQKSQVQIITWEADD